ncbi:Ig-like domain-containing protein [Pontibacter liquoris]|uniref:Ig-like domain-containing protein n=1 Tax=Pontibacter liquoris TaxID=2905677 RepID=UPI001FA805B0|nr:Ig-like domain-containing protein [Pontibacter liquoris]
MMNIKTMLSSLAVVGALALTACEDLFENGSLKPDGSNPSITINNPANNQVVAATQGLRVNITAVDKDAFKEIGFLVEGGAGEAPLVRFQKATDNRVLEFDTLVSLTGVAPGTYTLSINATDKRTNVTQKQVSFTVK